jgi:hypothetical protein
MRIKKPEEATPEVLAVINHQFKTGKLTLCKKCGMTLNSSVSDCPSCAIRDIYGHRAYERMLAANRFEKLDRRKLSEADMRANLSDLLETKRGELACLLAEMEANPDQQTASKIGMKRKTIARLEGKLEII